MGIVIATVREVWAGRWFRAFSLVIAVASLAVAPVIPGPLGILTGIIAVCKGDQIWGMVGVTASAALGITRYFWPERCCTKFVALALLVI